MSNAPSSTPIPFDIAHRQLQISREVVLYDPAAPGRVDTGLRITIASPVSPIGVAAEEQYPLRFGADGKIDMTDAEFDEQLVHRLVAVTLAWTLVEGGAPVACTPEEVRRIYTAPEYRWIRGQVRTAWTDMSGFFDRSKGT